MSSHPGPPHLEHAQLLEAQAVTLASPRLRYGLPARFLFSTLDLVYGKRRTPSKFKVLELVARVPYQSWEQVAYIALTHVHERIGLSKRIHDRVLEARSQQDNESLHLLILEDMIGRDRGREGRLRFRVTPQLLAVVYYQLSFLLYVVQPRWSYRLNADFEDHAEHEYMQMVEEHPDWETAPWESELTADYGEYASIADLFRQIAHDERVHKEASLDRMKRSRFS